MLNIKNTIHAKIHMLAEKNIQKLLSKINFDKNITSCVQFNKLVQLESKIITCDLKKKGTDIVIILMLIFMLLALY